jgi:Tol biopolymer transport system component
VEPRIQYAKTSDGVSIAFATYREGRPLVWSTDPTTSHVQREWQQPNYRAAITAFAAQGYARRRRSLIALRSTSAARIRQTPQTTTNLVNGSSRSAQDV